MTPRARSVSLEAVVGGRPEETFHGPVFVACRRYPLDYRQGSIPLGATLDASPEILGVLSRCRDASPRPDRLLYLDIETTGLAGGTGTYPFLVGAGFFENGSFVIRQYFMQDLDEEPALLSAIGALLPRFEGCVTYNGRAFDLSLLETRFVLARRAWPGLRWHLDLLPAARRLWASRLADCRLVTVEAHALGLRREDDVPGSLIPALYFEYLRRRQPGALPRLFSHNRQDLLSLVALAGWVSRALTEPESVSLSAQEHAGLGRIWEPWSPERSRRCYQTALYRGLQGPERERLLLRLADLAKRESRWDEACALWQAAIRGAADFRLSPWEELAKYHEHKSRDLPTALRVVAEALSLARAHRAPPKVLDVLTHRLSRLTRRLSAPRASAA